MFCAQLAAAGATRNRQGGSKRDLYDSAMDPAPVMGRDINPGLHEAIPPAANLSQRWAPRLHQSLNGANTLGRARPLPEHWAAVTNSTHIGRTRRGRYVEPCAGGAPKNTAGIARASYARGGPPLGGRGVNSRLDHPEPDNWAARAQAIACSAARRGDTGGATATSAPQLRHGVPRDR